MPNAESRIPNPDSRYDGGRTERAKSCEEFPSVDGHRNTPFYWWFPGPRKDIAEALFD
jgi:hypothetical protein